MYQCLIYETVKYLSQLQINWNKQPHFQLDKQPRNTEGF